MIFPSKLSHSTFGQLLTMTPKSSIQFLGKEIIRILYANGLLTIAAAILFTDSVLYLHFGLMHHYCMRLYRLIRRYSAMSPTWDHKQEFRFP